MQRLCYLCNHAIAMPAMQALLTTHSLVGVGVPKINPQFRSVARELSTVPDIAFVSFDAQLFEDQLLQWLEQSQPDLVIVFAFPYRIPMRALAIPKFGFINIHPGVLPRYRGPDPIFWQIRNRDDTGGLTVHCMDENLDTGPIVEVKAISIDPLDTHGVLTGKYALTAAQHICAIVSNLPDRSFKSQEEGNVDYCPRPQFNHFLVDWSNHSVCDIAALIRASNPDYGGAICSFRGGVLRLQEASIEDPIANLSPQAPGTILQADTSNGILIQCKDEQQLRLSVVATEAGIFSAQVSVAVFAIQTGEQLGDAQTLA